ncbi:hypothetical protein LPJ56_002049 [Coemansia sp. RSA 2599]|nr:hypothetical protein LPJ56_002049 [Coemansia sp. RSA 2599]
MGSDKNTAKTTQTTIVWPDGSPDSVGIRGTFGADAQQWWQETIELRKTAADRYSVDLDLPPGRYEFKFVINNTDWQINAQMYASVDDGSGNTNNVLEVTAATKDRNISNNKKRGGGGSSKASSHTTLSVERAQNQSHGPGRDLDLDHDRDRVQNQEPDPSGRRGQASDSHAAGKDEVG